MKLFQFVFSLGILALLGYLGYKVVLLFINNSDRFDPNVLLVLSVSGLAFFFYMIIRSADNDNKILQQDKEQRIRVYEELVPVFVKQLTHGPNETDYMTETELEIINKKASMWLSQSSLKHYLSWRRETIRAGSGNDNILALLEFEKLLRSMRFDLGHKNESIESGAFLAMFIKDFDREQLKELQNATKTK